MWEEFSQRELLTTRISNVLRDYPLGPASLVEFVQNADDAGARTFAFVLDRGRREASGPTLVPRLEGRPSLLIVNDSTFSEGDFASITSLGISGKRTDSTKVGRWGLGFNVVYHFADVVSFLSREHLVTFDPHGRDLPDGSLGLRTDLVASEFLGSFPGQIDCFKGLDDVVAPCNPAEPFNGTAFHLPLRQAGDNSLVSEACLGVDELSTLLDGFAASAPEVMLFLKHVEQISVFDRHADGSLTLRRRTRIANAPELRELRGLCNCAAARMDAAEELAEADFARFWEVHFESEAPGQPSEVARWAVQSGVETGAETLRLARAVSQVPFVSVAVPLDHALEDGGRAYCFLPLPLRTGLPLHVNAFFALSSNRRELERAEGVAEGASPLGRWNEVLLGRALPRQYVALMERLAASGRCVESLWPVLAPPPFDELSRMTLSLLVGGRACVFSDKSGGPPLSATQVCAQDKLLRALPALCAGLEATGLVLVRLSEPVEAALRDADLLGKVRFTDLDLVTRELRKLEGQAWTAALVEELLDYLARIKQARELRALLDAREDDEPTMDALHHLDGLHVIPTRGQRFGRLRCPYVPGVHNEDKMFLIANADECGLMPDAEGLVSLRGLPAFRELFNESAVRHESNVQPLSPETLVSSGLIRQLLPRHWEGERIVFLASSEADIHGASCDRRAATVAAQRFVASKDGTKPALSRNAQKKALKKAQKNQRAAKKGAKNKAGAASPGDQATDPALGEAAAMRAALLPDKRAVEDLRDRLALVWRIAEAHTGVDRDPWVSYGDWPVVPLNEGFACSVRYASERFALCAWAGPHSELARQCSVLTFDAVGCLPAAVPRDQSSFFEAVRRSLEQTGCTRAVCQALAEAAYEGSLPRTPSSLRGLPIFETLSGRFSAVDGGLAEPCTQGNIQWASCSVAPSEADAAALGPVLGDWILASATARQKALLNAAGVPLVVGPLQFLHAVVRPALVAGRGAEFGPSTSLHVLRMVAALKMHGRAKVPAEAQQLLRAVGNAHVIAEPGSASNKRCSDFVDPNDDVFAQLLLTDASQYYPPRPYREPGLLSLFRHCGMQSLAQPGCFLRAAAAVARDHNVHGGELLLGLLVRQYEAVYSRWGNEDWAKLCASPFVPARRFGAGLPQGAPVGTQFADLRRRVERAAVKGRRGARVEGGKPGGKRTTSSFVAEAGWQREGRFAAEEDDLIANADAHLEAEAALGRAASMLQGGPAAAAAVVGAPPEREFVPLVCAKPSQRRRARIAGRTEPLVLAHDVFATWRGALVAPESLDSAPGALLLRLPDLYPPRPATVARHLSTCAKDWAARTAEWRTEHATALQGVVLAACAMLARDAMHPGGEDLLPAHKSQICAWLANSPFVLFDDGTQCHAASVCVDLDSDAGPRVRAVPEYLRGLEPLLVAIGSPTLRDAEAPVVHCRTSYSPQELLKGVQSSLDDPVLADVVFELHGDSSGGAPPARVFAHRLVLSCGSPHFRQMYAAGTGDTTSRLHVIHCADWVEEPALRALLRFVYTGNAYEGGLSTLAASDAGVSTVLCLLRLADMYNLPALLQQCEVWLAQSDVIDVYNVCPLLTHAHACQARQLERLCCYHIRGMLDVIKELPEFTPELRDLALGSRVGGAASWAQPPLPSTPTDGSAQQIAQT